MMTIIYGIDKDAMTRKDNIHYAIYQDYKNGKFKATHKRVTDNELYILPKLFIYTDHICVVTGNQSSGGKQYIAHCKSFYVSVDRKNKVVFLIEKKNNQTFNNMEEIAL